jgi:hypothetical protein
MSGVQERKVLDQIELMRLHEGLAKLSLTLRDMTRDRDLRQGRRAVRNRDMLPLAVGKASTDTDDSLMA